MTATKNSMFVRILLDASGSMLGSRSATIKGCNEYLDTLAADAVVSVARFAAPYGVKRLSTNVPPARAKVAVEDYECKGGTPLYDAIGTSIQEIDTESKEFDRVVMVIQTDGQETGESREFSLAQVRQLLTDKQEGEGWLVIFLGADLASAQQAEIMGVRRNTTATYAMGNSSQAFNAVNRATASYASGSNRAQGIADSAFTAEERDRIK